MGCATSSWWRWATGPPESPGPRSRSGSSTPSNDHLSRLSPGARDALQLASVLGRRFSAEELAAIAGTSSPAILAALREAMAAGLVIEDSGRLAFRHDLVREAVEASLPRTVRQSLRRRAVDVLLRDGTPPVEVAELVMEVAQPGDRRAIGILRQAAAETAHVSPTIASQLSRRALDLLPRGDPGRGSLVAETIAYIVQAGHAAEAVTLISAVAGDLADPAAEAEARLNLAILSMQYAPADVVEQCQRALSLTGVPSGLRIQLLSFLSLGLDLFGDVAGAQAPALEAAQTARAHGDLANEVVTLVPRAAHALAVGQWRQALDFADEAATRRHSVEGLAVRLWLPDAWKALILISLARLDEAFGLIDAGLQAAQRDGVAAKFRIWSMLRFRALFCSGRLADARAEAEAAIEMADEIGDGSLRLHQSHRPLRPGPGSAAHWRPGRAGPGPRFGAATPRDDGLPVQSAAGGLDAWPRWLTPRVMAGPVPRRTCPSWTRWPAARWPTSSPRMYADTAALTGMLLRAGRPADAESVVRRLEDFAAQHPDFPFLDSAAWHARAVLDSDPEAARQAVTLSSGGSPPAGPGVGARRRGAPAAGQPCGRSGTAAGDGTGVVFSGRRRAGRGPGPQPPARPGCAAAERRASSGAGLARADRVGVRRGQPGGSGGHQPRGRRPALPVAVHGQLSPAPRLHQAWPAFPGGTGPAGRTTRAIRPGRT